MVVFLADGAYLTGDFWTVLLPLLLRALLAGGFFLEVRASMISRRDREEDPGFFVAVR